MRKKYLPLILTLIIIASCHNNNDHEPSVIITGKDTTPPGEVQNLHIVSLDTALKLAWKNPSDPDLRGILILRRTDRYPGKTTGDGIKIYSGKPITSYTDINLINGRKYFFRVFTYDENFNFSNGVTISGIPVHKINQSDIPEISSPYVTIDKSIYGVNIGWKKAPGGWQYKVEISNSEGRWEFHTSSNRLHITGIPITTFKPNVVKISTCTTDFSMCSNGRTLSFSLPQMEALTSNYFFPTPNTTPQGIEFLTKIGDGILYPGSSSLKYISIYPETTTYFSIFPLNLEVPLESEGIVDDMNNIRVFVTLSSGLSGSYYYLKLQKYTYNVYSDNETEVTGIIINESESGYNCADMVDSGLSNKVIFSQKNKLFSANWDISISTPSLIYSADTTFTINFCRNFLDMHESDNVLLGLSSGNRYKIQYINIKNFSSPYTVTEFTFNNNLLPDIDIETYSDGNDTYHLALLSYNENNTSHLVLYYNNPSTGEAWKTFPLDEIMPWFRNFQVTSSDLYIDPASNILYAAAITFSTVGFFNKKNYVNVIPFQIHNGNINIIYPAIDTEETSTTFIFPQFSIKMVSPDQLYLASTEFITPILSKYELTGLSQAKLIGTSSKLAFNYIRGYKQPYGEQKSDSTIYEIKNGNPQPTFTNSSGQDFTVLNFDQSPTVIYVNNNTNLMENGNQIYSGSSSISYLTGPDFANYLPIITFTDTSSMKIGIKDATGWNISTLVNNSQGLCKSSFIDFYPILTTDSSSDAMMGFFIRSNNKKLISIIWQGKNFIRCETYQFTVTQTVDHMAAVGVNGFFYLTISQHGGTGGANDPVFSDLLTFNSDGTLIGSPVRIPDHATMAVPLINSSLTGEKMMVLYYNPNEHALKGYVPSGNYTTYLLRINIEDSAKEIHPYLHTSGNRFVLEFTDSSGAGLRFYP